MTMEIVKKEDCNPLAIKKQLREMDRGETCWVYKDEDYVFCVVHCNKKIYLSLKNYDTAQTYGSPEHLGLEVRELYEGESITIKFS